MKISETNSKQESASSPKPASEQKGAPAPRDPLKALAEAIRAETATPPANESEGTGEPAKGKPKSKPKNLEQLAEVLGLEVADLYDVAVSPKAKGAEALSLGRLKDLAAEHGEFSIKSLRLDEDRRAFETAKLEHEAELRALLQALPAETIKPEALQKLRAALGKKQAAQRERTLELIPEWSDEETRGKELKGMAEFLKGYGLPESYLLVNLDARVVRLVRESWQRAETIRKALERVAEVKPAAHGRPKTSDPAKPGDRQKNGRPNRSAGQVANFMATIQQAAQSRQG